MINIENWIMNRIANEKRVAIPIMTHPGIELIGKKVIDAVKNGSIHAMAVEKINAVFPVAATTMMMDLTLEAEAFGCEIEFQENEMPHIKSTIAAGAEGVNNLKVPDLNSGRVPEYLLANRLIIGRIKDKPVLAGTIGPFSLAGRLYGMSEFLMECYLGPEIVDDLLEKCTEFIIRYCLELKRNGSSGVIIAEPAAGLISNVECARFSSNYIRKIVEAAQDESFAVVLHNCGNKGHCTEAMLASGANAYHFGNAIDMVQTLDCCPPDKIIMGNVDPVGIMKMSTAAEVRKYVAKLLADTARFKNFILSTGCDLPPDVPEKNLQAFFEALEDFNSTGKKTIPISNL